MKKKLLNNKIKKEFLIYNKKMILQIIKLLKFHKIIKEF